MVMKSKILLHAWALEKKAVDYYIPYTHWVYLNEIVKYYDEVVLLSPCRLLREGERTDFLCITEFSNVAVYELPYSATYISAIKNFFKYKRGYKEINDVTTYYSRYPVPFGWLQKLYGKKSRRIIHYVGDPVDAAKNNPNFNRVKKSLLITAFKPENFLYNWACKGAKVFTNGYHLAERLKKNNITAAPVISTTLNDDDFYFEEKAIDESAPRIIYVGYLRKAKGLETILSAFKLINKQIPTAQLTIVGTGDFEVTLKNMVKGQEIKNVSFAGHIDNRDELNSLLRNHDIFCFASLSEGSPRVILEAMANGLAVVSTPVGSLPYEFLDNEEIVFAGFNDENDFYHKLLLLINNKDLYNKIREKSFFKVKNKTLKAFINTIFYES